MAEVKRDVIYSMLASTLPALGNFVAVALALRHMFSFWLGKSYALVSFFFIAIDLFNFGSARIFTVEAVRSSVPTLIFLDCLSALGSTAVFAPAGILLGRYGLIAQPEFVILMVLAPVCYGLSHFSLGALRACGRSGAICAISLTSALSRGDHRAFDKASGTGSLPARSPSTGRSGLRINASTDLSAGRSEKKSGSAPVRRQRRGAIRRQSFRFQTVLRHVQE